MTLRELRAEQPDLFMEQDWFDGEAFMDRPTNLAEGVAFHVSHAPMFCSVGTDSGPTATAAILAGLYLCYSDDPAWKRFLWTSDFDDQGQRIYVGGIGQAKKPGFQIHRHLEINQQWGWPTW